jgi:hypothetical protein
VLHQVPIPSLAGAERFRRLRVYRLRRFQCREALAQGGIFGHELLSADMGIAHP